MTIDNFCVNIHRYKAKLIKALTYTTLDSKRKSAYNHARMRAKKRYGIKITKPLWKSLGELIRAGRGQLVKSRPKHHVSVYDIKLDDQTKYRVCYRHTIECIVSFLPLPSC